MTTTRGQHLLGKEIGSCVLERLLGYGGTSAVFLARSTTSAEPVAVKVFLPRSTLDGQMRKSFYQRFLREAEAASQLEHPHILTIYSYGEQDGMPYIVMPYMPGGTLSEYVQRYGALSLQNAQRYIGQVASALDYAHAHGCVHCDVKPANILLDGKGNAALSDFGIVRLLESETAAISMSQTAGKASEVLMGTPDYISPEQALGEKLDGRSDVYSLGATLYYLLTGNPPFQSESPIALALMHVHETPTPLGLQRADITPQIDAVVAKALAKWPEERFQTAGDFSTNFEAALREEGVLPQPVPLASQQLSNAQKLPASNQPVVQIRPVKKPRFKAWQITLGASLSVLLVLSGILTVLALTHTLRKNPPQALQLPTPTPTATPAERDLLSSYQTDWPTSRNFFFTGSTYHIQNTLPSGVAVAFCPDHQFKDFTLSVDTRELNGSFDGADYYGVALRVSTDQSHYYLFEVSAGDNGEYGFLRHDGESWVQLKSGSIPNFLTRTNQHNVLTIRAVGTTFTFLINGKQLGKSWQDTSTHALSTGAVGLVVEEQNTEIVFSQLLMKEAGR